MVENFYIEGWFPIPEPVRPQEEFVQLPLHIHAPEFHELPTQKDDDEPKRGVIVINIAGDEEEEKLVQFNLDD